MAQLSWTDAEEIAIQVHEKFPGLDPLTVRITDLHRYVTELPGFADDPQKSTEGKLEAIQMDWHAEYPDEHYPSCLPVGCGGVPRVACRA